MITKKKDDQYITKADAFVCPFDQYLKQLDKWKKEHPRAIIKEEIKNISLGIGEVPDPNLIGRTTQVQILMIAYAVVYTEKQLSLTDINAFDDGSQR